MLVRFVRDDMKREIALLCRVLLHTATLAALIALICVCVCVCVAHKLKQTKVITKFNVLWEEINGFL